MSQPEETVSQDPVQANDPQFETAMLSAKKRVKLWLIILVAVNVVFFVLNIGFALSWKQETIRQVEKGFELADREHKLEAAEKAIEQLRVQAKQHADESEANRIKSEKALRETESSLARIKSVEKNMRR